MASRKAAKAKAAEAARAAKTRSSIFGIIFRFLVYNSLIVAAVLGFILIHNCKIAEKPWIPKSQGFCNDAAYALTKYELRDTTYKNFEKTIISLRAVLGQKFTPVVQNIVNLTDETLVKYAGEYYVKSVTYFNDTIAPQLANFAVLADNVKNEVYDIAVDASIRARKQYNIVYPQVVEGVKDIYSRAKKAIDNVVNSRS